MIKIKTTLISLILAIALLLADFVFFSGDKIFYLLLVFAFLIGSLPLVIYLIKEGKREKENNEMFLEFTRNLVESIKTGVPISKSIINLRNKDYGTLSIHIKKLANQISLGIPIQQALETFGKDSESKTIIRALELISQAEKAGGDIGDILDSVAK